MQILCKSGHSQINWGKKIWSPLQAPSVPSSFFPHLNPPPLSQSALKPAFPGLRKEIFQEKGANQPPVFQWAILVSLLLGPEAQGRGGKGFRVNSRLPGLQSLGSQRSRALPPTHTHVPCPLSSWLPLACHSSFSPSLLLKPSDGLQKPLTPRCGCWSRKVCKLCNLGDFGVRVYAGWLGGFRPPIPPPWLQPTPALGQ